MSEPRSAEDIAEALMTDGTMPSADEVYALCQDAVAGHQAMDRYEALIGALEDAGYAVIDTTTDEDDQTRLLISPMDTEMPAPTSRDDRILV